MIYEEIDRQNNAEEEHPTYGNNIVICHPQCMLGPHYYVFLPTFLVLSIFLIMLYLNVQKMLSPIWSYVIAITIAVWMKSYLWIGFSNPGIVTKAISQNSQDEHLNICIVCEVVKGTGVRHCSDCNSCIEGHDHHCPWIGKCVGQGNKRRFYFFLIMMFATFIVFFVGTTASASNQNSANN